MTYRSSLAGEVLSLPNCSLTMSTMNGVIHYENLHKTVRFLATDSKCDHLLNDILSGYKKGKKGAIGAKYRK